MNIIKGSSEQKPQQEPLDLLSGDPSVLQKTKQELKEEGILRHYLNETSIRAVVADLVAPLIKT